MFNGGREIPQPSTSRPVDANARIRQAHVRIIEEPAPKALRFRYECEGRSAGSIPGASSTPDNKTYPSIQVVGYQGRAVVVVSCVTKDEPYRPHPHNLVGREGCKRGVCTLEIPPETMMVQFCNLGIQCVKKKDIESALRVREEIRVDPFRTGFNHRNQPTSIDLNSVRLCFQVFLEGDKRGKFTIPLTPKVSQPIFDKKAMSDLIIVKLSDCVSPVDGDKREFILLCEKIAKEDIQVRFYEEKDGIVVWEALGDFQPSQVHKQVAISFKPPRYHNLEVTEPVKVFIQLKRPSDGATSEPLPFEFLPISKGRKRPKYDSVISHSQEMGLGNDLTSMNIKMEPKDIMYPWPPGSTIDVSDLMQTEVNQFKIPFSTLPSTSNGPPPMTSQNWNIQYMPSNEAAFNQSLTPTNMNSTSADILFGMGPQQAELTNIDLDSGELYSLAAGSDVANLSETFTANLLLTENSENNYQNSTDSLTRLTNNTVDLMCLGTNTFK